MFTDTGRVTSRLIGSTESAPLQTPSRRSGEGTPIGSSRPFAGRSPFEQGFDGWACGGIPRLPKKGGEGLANTRDSRIRENPSVGGPTGNLGPRPVVMESGWSELRRVADHSDVFQ
jgi:hypothetical protein